MNQCTLVNTSYFGGFNSLLSGRRRNEGGNKKHYDISRLEAAEKKSPRFYPQAEILGINLPMINHCVFGGHCYQIESKNLKNSDRDETTFPMLRKVNWFGKTQKFWIPMVASRATPG